MFNLNQTVERESGEKLAVLSVALIRSEAGPAGSHWLEIPYLEVIGPPGLFELKKAGENTVLYNHRRWILDEVPEDHTNGPWWNPGLVRYLFKSPISNG